MDIKYLSTFCRVVLEGNMTVAADKLAITQPAVSQQIRYLEKEFGVKLLTRGSREVKPTIQGQILYKNSTSILSLVQQTNNAIKALSLDLFGQDICMSTLNSIGLYLLSPVIGNFLKLNSSMKFSLLYGTGEDIIRRMQRDEVDVTIMYDLKKEYGKEFSSFKKIHLFKDEMYFVGPGRDTSLPSSIGLKDVGQRRLIQMTDLCPAFENMLSKKFEDQKLNIKPSFQSDNVGTLKRVIESGLGWGFLPAHSIRKQIRSGRLSVIQIEDFNYSVDVNLYHKGDKKKENIIQAFQLLIKKQSQDFF